MDDERSANGSGVNLSQYRDVGELAREGVTAARVGEYGKGYALLGEVCDRMRKAGDKLPAPVISFYALCLALHTRKYREAAELCQAAIDADPMRADYYANLAAVCAAAGHRRKALSALQRGLALDAGNAQLIALEQRMGTRRKPVIPFLQRSNPVNVRLGRIRHTLSGKNRGAKPAPPKGSKA
jgi:tetratricopeptide (TPR) repeat protein